MKLTFPTLLDHDPQSSLESYLNVAFYHPDKTFFYIAVVCPLIVLCSIIASHCSVEGSDCILDIQNLILEDSL